jgi:hypothetical protein
VTQIGLERHAEAALSPGWRGFAIVLASTAALAMLLVFLDLEAGVSYWDLVRDTNAIAGQPSYFGAYSNIGILLWASAASIGLFCWFALRDSVSAAPFQRPLLVGGLFMALACLDDMFMLHEHSYQIGIPEPVVLAAYGMLLLAFVASTLPILFQSEWPSLGAAMLLLGLSTLADISPYSFTGQVFVEEVSKVSGIAFLAYYLITLALTATRLSHGRPRPTN